ncbi:MULTISPECIES: hypothetical protein [Herbaspirillum]|uniref:Uncharacterized protein n=2 Tax=Herbaspirillum huttiense TaxID=863372 RepID=A0AAJ2HA48_9BURK|nr:MULTISPECIES: hypothetical protein [Herbaspirillum]MDR9836877.1 hypothetical protein [Herbaspirillum huttiense]
MASMLRRAGSTLLTKAQQNEIILGPQAAVIAAFMDKLQRHDAALLHQACHVGLLLARTNKLYYSYANFFSKGVAALNASSSRGRDEGLRYLFDVDELSALYAVLKYLEKLYSVCSAAQVLKALESVKDMDVSLQFEGGVGLQILKLPAQEVSCSCEFTQV